MTESYKFNTTIITDAAAMTWADVGKDWLTFDCARLLGRWVDLQKWNTRKKEISGDRISWCFWCCPSTPTPFSKIQPPNLSSCFVGSHGWNLCRDSGTKISTVIHALLWMPEPAPGTISWRYQAEDLRKKSRMRGRYRVGGFPRFKHRHRHEFHSRTLQERHHWEARLWSLG